MNGFSLLLAVASLNVVYSWRTGLDQQQEYVLQIEPEVVQALVAGEEIYSDIPADAGPFQRLCVVIQGKDGSPVRHTAAGEEQFRQLTAAAGRYASLDRKLVKPDLPPMLLWPGRSAAPEQTYGVTVGWQPDKNNAQQYLVQVDPNVLATLAIGDELYVPIDPAAGRPVRFVVKSGRENLPRLGGLGGGSQYNAPTAQAPAARNNRFGGLNDNSTNWDNSRYADTTRPQTRAGNGTDWAYGDTTGGAPRSLGTVPPGSPSQFGVPPAYVTVPPPPVTYPTNSQVPAAGGQLDPLRSGAGYANQPLQNGYAQPPPGYGPQPIASQQPQLPAGAPQFQPQYPETRVAALPPGPAAPVTTPVGINNGSRSLPQAEKPWGPLLFVTFALFFSIGGNLYLAYTALEFHSRYRSAIERLRAAARSA